MLREGNALQSSKSQTSICLRQGYDVTSGIRPWTWNVLYDTFRGQVILYWSAILIACNPLPGSVTYPGGDGSSIEKAVVVNAANENQGLTAEYVWLQDHYPGFHQGNEHLLAQNGRSYDQFDIVTKEGQNRSVYFDITPCFGK